MLMLCCIPAMAQRTTDKLDRGLVAVPSGSGSFVSWKIFGEEYYDTGYNLYRNGIKVNSTPLRVSNFTDPQGTAGSIYSVAAVVRGVEQDRCPEVKRLTSQYIDIPVADVTDRNGNVVTSEYIINDISLGDVDGDGVQEFIVKRNYSGDIRNAANTTKFHHLECYKLNGERLWWIDCGPNLMAGPDEQWDIIAYDWDMDGKAEAVMRGADNMYIHTATGKTIKIGNMNYVAPRDEYTHFGAEYLLYINGQTGEPYGWDGTSENFTPMAYPLPRFEAGESDYATVWGKADTGHRSSKHYFGAPYLDGRHPSIFLGRGCYTRHKMCALDVDPATHNLTQRWRWNEYSGGSPYFGQGFHNFAIADVDWDGRDEIVFGSMVIDDNGKGLCTTGLGHGDAQHCSDLDPYRHGQEQFTCNETSPACTYFNATTGKIYYRLASTNDDGRALCANFSDDFPGCLGRSTQSGLVSTVADKVINGGPATGDTNDALFWSHLNQRIYWDGDLLDEVFDSPGSDARAGAVYKPAGGRLFNCDGSNTNNSTKNNPGAIADIFGDWREEIVMRAVNNTRIRIYTTNIPTEYGIYTLWHDHQYRNSIVWQSVGYNQPPHKSYFIGNLEGITVAPPPFTMTGRTEVANGGTIGSSLDGQHVIVCETNDSKVTVADGAKPWVATFNVPSWVQGTNSTALNGNSVINYTYYTCDVEGGAFDGSTRLVKQGDGILNLPNVEEKHTGNTDIWAGTLNFDGKMLNSSVWLNRFAELNSNGGTFRRIKMDYASILRPGRADNKGTITTDSLLLGFGSRVVFDIYDDVTSDQINARLLTIEKKDWKYGPEYLTPVFEFANRSAEIAPGRYLLGKVETLTGNLGDLRIEGIDTKYRSQLSLEDGNLYLDISTMRDNSDIVWSGAVSDEWSNGGAENFIGADGNSDIFVSGDNVTFNDNASQFSINLTGDIEADSIIVDNNAQAYTFKGTGSIVGNTTLVKRGTNVLNISTDNTYTGGTRISGGTIAITSLANTNQAKGNLGAVKFQADKFIIENGSELRTSTAVTNGSPISFVGEEGGAINNFGDFIVDRAMSGTVLTKRGSGWMKLNVSNSALQRLVIAGGTVQCINCSTPAKTVEFQNGTLTENTSSSYNIDVPQGKRGTWNLVDRGSYSNKLTGKGTLTVYCPVVVGTTWNATRTQITGNWSGFEGTIICKVHSSDTRFTLDNGLGMPKGTMNIPAGVELQNSGKTYRIGKVSGTGSLGGSCSFSQSGTPGANTWQVGDDTNWNWSGSVTSNANFVKMGSGRLTYSGTSNNTGTIMVSQGELMVSSGILGTGQLTVAQGATLSGGNTTAKALTNASVNVNGTMHPGLAANAFRGALFFGGKNVAFVPGSVLEIRIHNASADNSGNTYIGDIRNLTMNGTLRVTLADNYQLNVGDQIRVWEATTFMGTPVLDLPAGIEWDTTRISEGILTVVATETEGIADVSVSHDHPADIYDVSGRMVRQHATSTKGLSSGVYVIRGKKVVVK